MANQDTHYVQPSSSDSEDTPPETTCSQMRQSSVRTPLTPSLTKSLEVFTFSTPAPSPSIPVRIRKPKRMVRKYTGNQYGKLKKGTPAKKYVKVGTTTPESVRVPAISKDTLAMRKLDFGTTSPSSKINMKVRSPNGEIEAVDVLPVTGNLIVNADSLISILGEVAVCRNCQLGTLELYKTSYFQSCATHLMFRCKKCFVNRIFWSVSDFFKSKIELGDKQISRRNDMMYASVLGGRLAGVGEPALRTYHAALNIPPPPGGSSFQRIQQDLLIASEYVANKSMMKAKTELEAIFGTNPVTNRVHAVVSYDGAYQIRSKKGGGGFSPYCFASAISCETGKVVAYDVACNTCRQCNLYARKLRQNELNAEQYDNFYKEHNTTCPAKFSQYSSTNLESLLAPLVVRQAYDRGIIFSGIVSDGDNKTDIAIKDADIYKTLGFDDLEIGRLECLSHVLKRMKANLCHKQEVSLKDARRSKEVYIKELIESGKSKTEASKILRPKYAGTLRKVSKPREGWKSSSASVEIKYLSEAMCGQITSYFRLAVQRNKGDIDAIIKAIKAIPYHLGANDDNSEEYHRFCPFEEDSWCMYQSAIYNNKPPPHHPNYLSEVAVNMILDLFDGFKFTTPGFIEKIKTALTSNYNESIHSVLFDIVPKKECIGYVLMRFGAALAVIRFNDGYKGIRELFEAVGITPGAYLSELTQKLDTARIIRSQNIVRDQKRKFSKTQRRGKKVASQILKHGQGYASGKYTSAQPDPESDTDDDTPAPTSSTAPHTDVDEYPLPPAISLAIEISKDSCDLCGFTDKEGLVGIGLGVPIPPGKLKWVQCETCSRWFHLLCLGIENSGLPKGPYMCDYC